jgi:hypothetical protein
VKGVGEGDGDGDGEGDGDGLAWFSDVCEKTGVSFIKLPAVIANMPANSNTRQIAWVRNDRDK